MKIGILQTGLVPESLAAESGQYANMFERLLADRGFTFETWSVVEGEFPSGPEAAEGWLITGSRHGAYEDHDWIPPLEELIRAIYASDRPMIGVCFGHQIIAQALGGKVEKFAGGWSVGAQGYDFPGGALTLNAWHQDQVVNAPKDATVVASNDFCANAALLYGKRAYTVQPHPEFGDDFVAQLIDKRGRGVVPDDQLEAAQQKLGGQRDGTVIADQFERFFKSGALA